MKRYIRSDAHKGKYTLRIIVDVGPATGEGTSKEVAASTLTYIKDPNIKKSLKLSEKQKEQLDGMIGKVLELIRRYEFPIISYKQSPKSYSFYIKFTPTDANGDKWPVDATIQFEVRDHRRNDLKGSGWANDKLYIRIFPVGDNQTFDTNSVIPEIRKILHQLQNGDYSSLGLM